MEPLTVVASDDHRAHDPPYELNFGRTVSPVWDRPARAETIREALEAAGHQLVGPAQHGVEALHRVHDPDLVRWAADAHARWRAAGGPEVLLPDTFASHRWRTRRPTSPLAEPGWWCIDTATPLVEGSYVACRAAVDIALTGVDRIRDGERGVYALCRPPGHHAGRDYYGGFCLFNNAAVAADELSLDGSVAVLDVDYHHGNGTQEILWERGDVLYVSIHGDPAGAYPYFTGFGDEVGQGRGRGATRNLPMAPGTADAAYLDALAVACEVVAGFGADTLVVSLGIDTFGDDPICDFDLTAEAYGRIGRAVAALGLPTLFVQEGGYAVEQLGQNVAAVLEGFRDAAG